jgi:hypothetical protein
MSSDKNTKEIIFEQSTANKDEAVPDVFFLDNLDSGTLKIVELIMVAGTGQKDIINRIRSMHQRTGDFNAA